MGKIYAREHSVKTHQVQRMMELNNWGFIFLNIIILHPHFLYKFCNSHNPIDIIQGGRVGGWVGCTRPIGC